MQFAILECRGYDKNSPPEERNIKEVLEPFLLKQRWSIVYVAYIKDVATLVGIRSDQEVNIGPTDMQKVFSDFKKFVDEKYGKLSIAEQKEADYPTVHLGQNIEIVVLLASTEQDGSIFANRVVATQMEKNQKELEEVKEKFSDFAEKFKHF
jgi:hypothetical protein